LSFVAVVVIIDMDVSVPLLLPPIRLLLLPWDDGVMK
jgi:hypothetical protein